MIEFKGIHTVAKTREQLWPILLDPGVLKKCIPGCEELTRNSDNLYAVRLKVGLGLVKGSFDGTVQLTDIVEPEKYVLNIKADGKTGFALGQTHIRLIPSASPGRTDIHFESHLQVGGLIAAVGARLFQGAAKTLAEQFFKELEKCIF